MEAAKETRAGESLNSSVIRAFDILEHLNTCGKPMTVAELCRELDLNRITCTNLVKTMIGKKYLYKNEAGKICLTGKIYVMGQIYREGFPILERFNSLALELTKNFNCLSHLVTFAGLNQGILLSHVPGVSIYSDTLHLYVPLYCTGAGKVLLAYQTPQMRSSVLKSLDLEPKTENTITSKEKLIEELDVIKLRGYAIDNKEFRPGLFCVSAPVFSMDGSVSMAVSLTHLQIDAEHSVESHIPAVRTLAQTLSHNSGYRKVNLESL